MKCFYFLRQLYLHIKVPRQLTQPLRFQFSFELLGGLFQKKSIQDNMTNLRTNVILPEEGDVTEKTSNILDYYGNVLDLVGGFGVYQKRLYIIPYERVII